MTQKNPLGQHIQRVKAPDDNWIVDQCQKAAYTTVTVLDAASLSGRIQSEGGVPYTIFRDSGFEPVPSDISDAGIKAYAKIVYEQIRQKAAATGNPSVHIMLNCEQGSAPHRIKMYTEIMNLSATDTRGVVGIVFLNASVGSIRTGFWGQENEFSRADMIEFVKTLDKYRNVRLPSGAYAFVLGCHNYTSQYAWIACNGGEYRSPILDNEGKPTGQYNLPTWNTANKVVIDWNKAQDHFGREYQGIRKALGWLWNNSLRIWYTDSNTIRRPDGSFVEPPWIILTEMFIDGVGGVPIQAKHIDGNATPYGFNSMKTEWEQYWFKPDPHGLTLAKMSEWAWRVIFQPEGYFIGGNNYCIGNTGGWESHTTTPNSAPNMDYFNAIKPIRFEMPTHFFTATAQPPTQPPTQPPVTPTVPFPPNTDASWKETALISLSEAGARIRQQPSTTATVAGVLLGSKEGFIALDKVYTASDNFLWYPIRLLDGTLQGWARQDVFTFVLKPTNTVKDRAITLHFKASDEDYLAIKRGLAAISNIDGSWIVE